MIKKYDEWLIKNHKTAGTLILADVYYKKYWKYFKYPSKEYNQQYKKNFPNERPEHRRILDHEIIIETDLPEREQNKEAAKIIQQILEENSISYTKWFSGNKSYHFHTLWLELKKVFGSDHLKLYKNLIMKNLFSEELISKFKIDMGLTGKHMIRSEYGIHSKTGKHKIFLLEESYGPNKVPLVVNLQFLGEKEKYGKWKENMSLRPQKAWPCTKFFLNHYLPDGKKRGAFIIISNLKITKNKDELRALMLEWADKIQRRKVNSRTIESCLHNQFMKKNKDKRTGCSYANMLLVEVGRQDVCKDCVRRTK